MPKAVIHAQRTVRGAAEFAADVLGVGPDARVYASSKLFFAYALGNGLFGGLGLGATVVLDHEWPTAERVAAVVARLSPTVLFSVPDALPEDAAGRCRAQARHACSISSRRARRCRRRSPTRGGTRPGDAVNAYGASETLVLMLYCADGSWAADAFAARRASPAGARARARHAAPALAASRLGCGRLLAAPRRRARRLLGRLVLAGRPLPAARRRSLGVLRPRRRPRQDLGPVGQHVRRRADARPAPAASPWQGARGARLPQRRRARLDRRLRRPGARDANRRHPPGSGPGSRSCRS